MKTSATSLPLLLLLFAVPWSASAATLKCPPDSVKVGNVCIDTYEASVWQIAPSNTKLVKLVQSGKATLAALTAGGATQVNPASSSCTAFPANFPKDGNWVSVSGSSPPSPGVYAVSIPGVHPTDCVTWFQAEQACLLSGKRLLTNREWQGAASGTPDPGTDNGSTDCNISGPIAVNTGSRSSCKSNWGVFDMVGNVEEWVADWTAFPNSCTDWTSATGVAGGDVSCFGGTSGTAIPGALFRGGGTDGSTAGVFAVNARSYPSNTGLGFGFRCAR